MCRSSVYELMRDVSSSLRRLSECSLTLPELDQSLRGDNQYSTVQYSTVQCNTVQYS